MSTAKRPAPISSHPAFKWGVGAWFALLLGLGLFVMPAAIHQLIAEKLSLDGILPGATAIRAVLSGGAALLGLAIGLLLAMRVIAVNDASAAEDHEAVDHGAAWLYGKDLEGPAKPVDDAPRRPFNPREDLAEAGIGPFEAADAPVESPAEDEDIADLQFAAPVAETDDLLAEDAFDIGAEDEIEAAPCGGEVAEDPQAALPDESDALAPPPPEPEDGEQGETATQSERAAVAFSASTAPGVQETALGDLSLEALTKRLGEALAAHKAERPAPIGREADPVIAFLRREAERETASPGPLPRPDDPQAELRSALDKLSRVGKPK